MKKVLIIYILFLSFSGHAKTVKPRYNAIGGAIVGYNIGSYNNRPLYINNTNAFILTGDQPIARLVKGEHIYGSFMLAIKRDGKGKWTPAMRANHFILPARVVCPGRSRIMNSPD